MAMNPRTHPVGAPPDFTLPRPNPNPQRMTDALWWLVCMREALEPALSANGGTYADKAGSHNIGANLPDHGEGNIRTDHSIRHAWNRTGPWWKTKCAAHDWTFVDAQRGDYRTINKYTRRLVDAMRDPADLRPDRVVFYTLGNLDGDVTTEGWNELKDGPETSGDNTHAWHRHDSFFRNAVGDHWAMWAVLTIDMGWTYQQWQQSVQEDDVALSDADKKWLAAEIDKAATAAAQRVWYSVGITDAIDTATPKRQLTGAQWLGWSDGRHRTTENRILAALGQDRIDEQALAAALAPALVQAVQAADEVTPAELQQAIVGALRELANPAG